MGLVFLQDPWWQLRVGGLKPASSSSYYVSSWQCNITFLSSGFSNGFAYIFAYMKDTSSFMRHLGPSYSLTGGGNPAICMSLSTSYSTALLLLWSCPVSPCSGWWWRVEEAPCSAAAPGGGGEYPEALRTQRAATSEQLPQLRKTLSLGISKHQGTLWEGRTVRDAA